MKVIYKFANGKAEGSMDLLNKLGGKGAGLHEMTNLGLPVPPGFTMSTDFNNLQPADGLKRYQDAILWLEDVTELAFGKGLVVSVRSGAAVSMPGMMETVLDVVDYEELCEAVEKVFDSWNSERAETYRKIKGIDRDLGTAVTVQQMVFGDSDDNSGSGVLFSRNPVSGMNMVMGEFIRRAKGDQIVGGTKTPEDLSVVATLETGGYAELREIAKKLEKHFKLVQDVEFTIESGEVYILQTRNAKLSPRASVRVAVEMVEEGLINQKEALGRVDKKYLKEVDVKVFDLVQKAKIVGEGISVCPGVLAGIVTFDSTDITYVQSKGYAAILVKGETSTEDVRDMEKADGIITLRGGLTSHAATIARSLKKPCIVGVGELPVGRSAMISMDGFLGIIYEGMLNIKHVELDENIKTIKSWERQCE